MAKLLAQSLNTGSHGEGNNSTTTAANRIVLLCLQVKRMPTLFTDPRSGGIKKSSGVNVLPIVAETWAQVRDDSNTSVDWLIASFHGNSKTDITVIASGSGGLEACASMLPENNACYGGVKLKSGRFVCFYHAPEGCPVMQRGRGVLKEIYAQ